MKNFQSYLENEKMYNNEVSEFSSKLLGNEYKSCICFEQNKEKNYKKILKILEFISDSNLKYSRKIEITYNSNEYKFFISDIHIEIDFDLLGVNESNIFIEIMNHIHDNTIFNKKKRFFILCLNFENIKKELLRSLYSFYNPNSFFVFLTNQICMFPRMLLDISYIKKWNKHRNEIVDESSDKNYLNKLIEIADIYKTNGSFDPMEIRNISYDMLVKNMNIYHILSCLVKKLVDKGIINDENILKTNREFIHDIERYNNNYRSIFHIEKIMFTLMRLNE